MEPIVSRIFLYIDSLCCLKLLGYFQLSVNVCYKFSATYGINMIGTKDKDITCKEYITS